MAQDTHIQTTDTAPAAAPAKAKPKTEHEKMQERFAAQTCLVTGKGHATHSVLVNEQVGEEDDPENPGKKRPRFMFVHKGFVIKHKGKLEPSEKAACPASRLAAAIEKAGKTKEEYRIVASAPLRYFADLKKKANTEKDNMASFIATLNKMSPATNTVLGDKLKEALDEAADAPEAEAAQAAEAEAAAFSAPEKSKSGGSGWFSRG